MTLEALSCLAAGCFLFWLAASRQQRLATLRPEQLAELDRQGYNRFREALATAYHRTRYLGVGFIALAASMLGGWPMDIKAFFLLLVLMLFLINLPPRHAAMKELLAVGLDRRELRGRGVPL